MITQEQYKKALSNYKAYYEIKSNQSGELTNNQYSELSKMEEIMSSYDLQEKARFIKRLNDRDGGNREALTVGEIQNYFLDILEKMEKK